MRTLTFILGAILAAYSLVGILSETLWSTNEQVNGVLCRLFLRDNAPLVSQAREQLAGIRKKDVQGAISLFRTTLQQDPHNPYRWGDLGEAFLEAGQREEARYCFGQVLALAPRSANLLLRAANFYLQIGDDRRALPITAKILALTPEYDSIIFSEYTRFLSHPEDVLRYGLPDDRRAARSWLEFLIDAQRLEDAQRTWDWVAGRGYADDALAGEYVEFLIRQGRPDSACSAWIQHLGARSSDYRKSTYLFNGDFESAPTHSPFDWSIAHSPGVEVARDCTTAWSGKCSIRISFAGTRNLDFAAISQLTLVPSGPYRFQALVRTEGLTTDQGLRFRISDAEVPARLDVVFAQITRTTPWSEVEHDLTVPPQTRLLRVQVIRQASMKFDNKIGGTAWIDEMRLEPITSRR